MDTSKESTVSNNMVCRLVFSIILYAIVCVSAVIVLHKTGFASLAENKSFTVGMSVILVIPSILYLRRYYQPVISCNISNKVIAAYIVIGITATSLVNYPYKVISGQHAKPMHYHFFINASQQGKLLLLIILVVLAPIIEEIFNRYYAYNILKDKYGVKSGILMSSFIYMILHGELSLLLFVFGIIFAIVYEKTKKIWASMIVHGAMNLIWFTLVYFA